MIAGGVTHALRVRRVRFAPVADVVTRRSEPAVVTVQTDGRVVRNVARAASVTVRITGTVWLVTVVICVVAKQKSNIRG